MAPPLHPGEISEPPPPRLAVGSKLRAPPPEEADPNPASFLPAPPDPYIISDPEIFELSPMPPLISLPTPPAPPPPPAGYGPVPVPPTKPEPLVPPTALFVTARIPPAAVTVAN